MAAEDIAERIRSASREARVVLIGSALTDIRDHVARLEQAGVAHREIRLPMGDQENRESFRMLTGMTGSKRLPQCFIDGRFVGGPLEMQAHLGLGAAMASGNSTRTLAMALGYAGLLPVVLGGALVLLPGFRVVFGVDTLFMLVSYAAVILSFLGAVHWGVALAGPLKPFKSRLLMGLSVVPALLAWLALLAGPAGASTALLLLLGFALWWVYEWTVPGRQALAEWYLRLRLQLTAVVCGVLLLVWLRLLLTAA